MYPQAIIAVTNQKGGVAKTTTAVNLAASFHRLGQRILLIDLDPQGNASSASASEQEPRYDIVDVLSGECTVDEAIQVREDGYDIIRSSWRLTGAEALLLQSHHREHVLQKAFAAMTSKYDIVFLDCPPSLNIITVNALVAAHAVLIPVQCEFYALEGLTALLKTIQRLQQAANPDLHILAIVRTMFDGRNRLTHDVSQQLREFFKEQLMQTVIPRNVRLAEAPSHSMSAIEYAPHCQGSLAYFALAMEIQERIQQLTDDKE